METIKKIVLKDGIKVQRIREFLGVKQEVLAKEIGVSPSKMSIIENEEHIDENLLSKIANALGVKTEVIASFDEDSILYSINHYNDIHDNEFKDNAIAQQFNPIEKVVELYERLLASEREKIELLKTKQ